RQPAAGRRAAEIVGGRSAWRRAGRVCRAGPADASGSATSGGSGSGFEFGGERREGGRGTGPAEILDRAEQRDVGPQRREIAEQPREVAILRQRPRERARVRRV